MRHRNYVCVFAEVMYDLVSAALAPPPRAREEPRRNRPRPRAARCYHEGGPTVVRRITRERETVELILSPDPTGYQSRHGLIDQPTLPMARLNMDANPVRDYPLSPPKPVVDLYRNSRRPAYPGAGSTGSWPAVITR